jgi:hypothetical protein
MSEAQTRAKELTFRYEKWRAISAGIVESGATTFLLLIAVRWYDLPPFGKALIACGGSIGLVLSPLVVSIVAHRQIRPSHGASRVAFLGALAFLLPAIWAHPFLYVFGSVVGMACSSAAIPLLTQMYQENYPEKERGRLFSRTVMIRIATAALFSELIGRILSVDLRWFQALLLVFAVAFGLSSVWLRKCPTTPLDRAEGVHPLKGMRFVKEDPVFRLTLICWMLMGIANLMMLPLRVEYLANPKYGKVLSVGFVALLTGVIPNLARLVMSPIWGWLFDHMNFFLLRVVLNLGFAIGIASFFTSDTVAGLVVAAIIFGVSNAGGDVAWSLWVTKFAPPGRVADYMAVHTFFTGVRGIIAPFLAFWLVSGMKTPRDFAHVSWAAAGLILVASALLLKEIKWDRKPRKGTPLVEEVAE